MKQGFSDELHAPPALVERFVQWCLPTALKEPIVGDLSEEFNDKANCLGLAAARSWYLRQAWYTAVRYLWKNKKGLLMFVLGILAFLATVLMAFMLSGELWMFANLPSFFMVVPPAILFAVSVTSKQTCLRAIQLIFDEEVQPDLTELNAAKHVFSVMGNASVWLGALGTVIGWVAISTNIEPETFKDVIGNAFAVSLLTALYAFIVKILCYVGEQKIQHRIILATQ